LQNFDGGPAASPQQMDRRRAVSTASRELGESLSAIGAYIAAARRLLTRQATLRHSEYGDVLDKAAAQADRAGEAFRQLRVLIKPGKED
jgi:phosphoglycerate-specific signal transduction histidine kinase